MKTLVLLLLIARGKKTCSTVYNCSVMYYSFDVSLLIFLFKLLFYTCTAAAQWTSPPTKACQAAMAIRVLWFNCTVNDQCDTVHCISTFPDLTVTVAIMLLPCNHPPAVSLSFNGSLNFDDVISKSKSITLERQQGTLSVRLDHLPNDVIGIRIGYEVSIVIIRVRNSGVSMYESNVARFSYCMLACLPIASDPLFFCESLQHAARDAISLAKPDLRTRGEGAGVKLIYRFVP